MACCDNTYNLGCVDSCAMVTLPIVFPTDGHYTLYFSGTNNVKITVSGVSGEPILLDATLLNANSIYTFYIQNTSGVRQLFEIGEVEYDCFKIKIDAYFSIDATEDITPTQHCTLMCQETYDPTGVGADAFNYNNLHTKAVSDGITITGDGTAGNPFVAIGGGGIDSVQAGTNIIIDNSDPLNPIVSTSSSLFPNGQEFITESRDFQASDEGKLLILLGSNITLTMPSGVTFTQGATLGIYSVGINNKFQSLQGGAFIEPYAGGEEDNNGEIVYLTVSSDGVNDILSSVSSAFVAEKTLNKYLYDKANANNYFGTATLAMGTVTVSDIRVKTGDIIFVSVNTPSGTLGFLSASTADIVDGTEFVINSSSALDNSTVNWWIKTP